MKTSPDKKPDVADVLALAGAVLLVAGVWVLYSVGHALVAAGVLFLVVAVTLAVVKAKPWAI